MYIDGKKVVNIIHESQDITIDQTYNSESENPQAGIAVAEAIKGGAENIDYAVPLYNTENLKASLDAMASDVWGLRTHAIMDVDVDSEHNPESTKPQSGIAVAEAIKGGAENIYYAVPWYNTENLKASLDAMSSDVLGLTSHSILDTDVDTGYNPESRNPQSGIAVAEAISGVTPDNLVMDYYGNPKTLQKAIIDLDTRCNKLTFADNVNYKKPNGEKISVQQALDLIFDAIENSLGLNLRGE